MDHGRQLAARPVLMNAKSWLPSNALRRLFSFHRQDMVFNVQKINCHYKLYLIFKQEFFNTYLLYIFVFPQDEL